MVEERSAKGQEGIRSHGTAVLIGVGNTLQSQAGLFNACMASRTRSVNQNDDGSAASAQSGKQHVLTL